MTFRTRDVPLTLTRTGIARSLTLYSKFLFTFAGLSLFIGPLFAFFGALWALVAVALTLTAYALALLPATFSGALEVTPEGLSIGTRAVPRGEVLSALVVPRDGHEAVEIELADGERLTARCAGTEARALVEALAVRRLRVPLARDTYRLVHLPVALFAVVLAVALGVLVTGAAGLGYEAAGWSIVAGTPGMAIAVYTLLQRLVRPPVAVVGDDGVRIERSLGRRHMAHGEPLDLKGGLLLDRARVDAVSRLSEERAKGAAEVDERLALFDRRGGTLEAWRARVAKAMDASSYRDAPVTVEDAAAVLRSAKASPEQRVGAALALRAAGEPAEKIRVAAGAIVDERVRVAIERVAEDDEPAVERALEESAMELAR
jgi:hypothetical protein